MEISSRVVGSRDRKDVVEWTMKVESGDFEVTCLSFGCAITKILMKDKEDKKQNITICHQDYASLSADENRGPYFGCVAGRVANRIANGKFSLNDEDYSLFVNNGVNTNHGGAEGFDRKVWDSKAVENGVEFTRTSPNGEEGFPGTLELRVTYRIVLPQTSLDIAYHARIIDGSMSTPINLTNHTYFNLNGGVRKVTHEGDHAHKLKLFSSHYTPVDATQIPTGEIKAVAGTEFDYREFRLLSENVLKTDGAGKAGLDHNFVVDGALPLMLDDPEKSINSNILRPVAEIRELSSGRVLKVSSTQPGIQVYTANWLSENGANSPFCMHNGIALESQHFPNSINQPTFPNTVLKLGKVYSHRTLWEFSVERE